MSLVTRKGNTQMGRNNKRQRFAVTSCLLNKHFSLGNALNLK